jgi:hypothetical protein
MFLQLRYRALLRFYIRDFASSAVSYLLALLSMFASTNGALKDRRQKIACLQMKIQTGRKHCRGHKWITNVESLWLAIIIPMI